MNYSEKRAGEILKAMDALNKYPEEITTPELMGIFETKIKEVIRDTRHKCAENIVQMQGTGDGYTILKTSAHNIVMNTNLD